MTSRRTVLRFGAASALLAPFQGFGPAAAQTASQGGASFRFGVIADPQYSPVVPNLQLNRFYSNTLTKLSEAVTTLNKEDLAFVVTLGDIIDRDWTSFAHVMPVYDRFRAPRVFLLGNHDYSVAADYLGSILRTTGMSTTHYDFAGGGFRFVVLDQNDVSLFANRPGSAKHALATSRIAEMKARGAINAQTYNGSMGDEQYVWLEGVLTRAQQANERVIVMGHYPIYPAHEANLLDDERLAKLLSSAPHVVAYFNGHQHLGNYGRVAATHFVNFHGMVNTPDTTAYAIVEVYPDRLDVRGFGREPNRTLPFA